MLHLQEHYVEELAAESSSFAAFVHFFSHKVLPHVYLGRSCFAKICSSFSPLNWKHSNLYLHFKRLRTQIKQEEIPGMEQGREAAGPGHTLELLVITEYQIKP
jgi:hypothetical protein